jgi:homospermidine synthase
MGDQDYESVGVLIKTKKHKSWWYGSSMTVAYAKQVMGLNDFNLAKSNVTLVQTAAGLYAGLQWMVDNPTQGITIPEDMNYYQVLKYARPFLQPLELHGPLSI